MPRGEPASSSAASSGSSSDSDDARDGLTSQVLARHASAPHGTTTMLDVMGYGATGAKLTPGQPQHKTAAPGCSADAQHVRFADDVNLILYDTDRYQLIMQPDGGSVPPAVGIVDRLGTAFLSVSVPVTVAVVLAAVVLYSQADITAATVSQSICGVCAFVSLVLCSLQVAMHLSVYTNPTQQRYIIRIILMCPIYAVDSFVGLVAYRYAVVVNLVRDTYESYVIYMFFQLLMDYLGGEDNVVARWAETMPEMTHIPPLCCLKPLKLNKATLKVWKALLIQYMVLYPLCTLIAVPLYFAGYWHDGQYAPTSLFMWFGFVQFVSVTFAFTSLVYFFFGSKHLMDGMRPLPKFAAIKTVVFVSFWQTAILTMLNRSGVIPHTQTWTSDEVATGLSNFVMCVEMYLMTIAHRWVFTDAPYRPATGRSRITWWAVKHAFDVTDVVRDAANTARGLLLERSIDSGRQQGAARRRGRRRGVPMEKREDTIPLVPTA